MFLAVSIPERDYRLLQLKTNGVTSVPGGFVSIPERDYRLLQRPTYLNLKIGRGVSIPERDYRLLQHASGVCPVRGEVSIPERDYRLLQLCSSLYGCFFGKCFNP